ncbi:RNA-guided endonuclease InsQ/TnpB family protein [Cyanobacterium aponinum]|uniref:Transposase, IS605 OrfB family n=1 Tax=Cyanobacterium aponinum (strain PCC 10605) TaxID=755178 RepID=K9Z897_CYAAP|nr:RNA-guided endonuclease TnpB family protein [Cyanobacterium aponinum]AFZ54800.1 transposase, IS605 OrfB family [Cyanobacterium aponinum PCC 10605]
MIVLEYKLNGNQYQYQAIDSAIRTAQFIRNKALRLWMDGEKVNKYDLNKYCAVLAQEYPFARQLNSTARQASAERAWSAISRFFDNCKKGIKGKKGYPKFKKNSRSVEYKDSGWKLDEKTKKHVTFTDKKGIGRLKLVGSRDIYFYNASEIKRVRLVKRADGYYCQFSVKVNVQIETQPTNKVIGLDVGLKEFLTDSEGNTVENPRFLRKSEKALNRANRQKSKKFVKGKKPQSNNYHKARNRYARKHLRVSRQRKEFAKSVAYCVIHSADLVAYEDLNVKGMVRNRKLAKSISDAGWTIFRGWLEYFGHKYGKITVAVPPHNTSQDCSNCGQKVQKSLSTRTHVCAHCGHIEDRDSNAAKNILIKALRTVGHTGTFALGDLPSWAIADRLSSNGESVNKESPTIAT